VPGCSRGPTPSSAPRAGGRQRAGECGGFFGSRGRELSDIRNVARSTTTVAPHRGHLGVMVLPVTPSRYDKAQSQCGQGPKCPVAIRPPFAIAAYDRRQQHGGHTVTWWARRRPRSSDRGHAKAGIDGTGARRSLSNEPPTSVAVAGAVVPDPRRHVRARAGGPEHRRRRRGARRRDDREPER
jgi:hypothetical protein